jgi:protein arginine N-methyltransferase 1
MSARRGHLDLHRQLVTDRLRVQQYRRAIEATIQPGDVVLDLGAGTGILTVLACRAGAQRVYAVESTEMIDVAREVCTANGVHDRVVFVRGRAEHTALPGRVDAVITETLGNFGIDEGIVGLVADARARHLSAGGRIVPRGLELVAAPVEVPDDYAREIDVWAREGHGVDVSGVRSLAANAVHAVVLDPGRLLALPARLSDISLPDAIETDVHGEARWTAMRAGTMHGLGGWFSAELAPGIVLSNAPPLATPNWAHAFLPLEQPVDVVPGEEILAVVSARANGSVWYWHVTVAGREVAAQSTLWGTPGLREHVRRGTADHAPGLTAIGRAHLDVLQRMDGRTTRRELGDGLHRAFPDLFSSAAAAEAFVEEIAARTAE